MEENNILEITDKKSALSVTPHSVSWPEGTVLTTAGHQSDHTGPATLDTGPSQHSQQSFLIQPGDLSVVEMAGFNEDNNKTGVEY